MKLMRGDMGVLSSCLKSFLVKYLTIIGGAATVVSATMAIAQLQLPCVFLLSF
jgi:hypothetical protein